MARVNFATNYGNLVSDTPAPTDEPWLANMGITLPDEVDATHNAGLTPIFANRTGRGRIYQDRFIRWRGDNSMLWSSTASSDAGAYFVNFFLTLDTIANLPSNFGTSIDSRSLRCLVSTY